MLQRSIKLDEDCAMHVCSTGAPTSFTTTNGAKLCALLSLKAQNWPNQYFYSPPGILIAVKSYISYPLLLHPFCHLLTNMVESLESCKNISNERYAGNCNTKLEKGTSRKLKTYWGDIYCCMLYTLQAFGYGPKTALPILPASKFETTFQQQLCLQNYLSK